jgi:hypothetical protein
VLAGGLPWAVELARTNPGVALAPSGDAEAFGAALHALLAAPPPAAAGAAADLDAWASAILALYG